jgi:hypothetical protein
MINALIRAGGICLGAPIALAGNALEAVGVLNFTGWQRQMKEFGAEMQTGAEHIARQREDRAALVDVIAELQQADPAAVAATAALLLEARRQTENAVAAAAAVASAKTELEAAEAAIAAATARRDAAVAAIAASPLVVP